MDDDNSINYSDLVKRINYTTDSPSFPAVPKDVSIFTNDVEYSGNFNLFFIALHSRSWTEVRNTCFSMVN
jgi:hypothetical protein